MSQPLRPLAVVTGASSGIGYELARLAAEDGYDLVVAADRPEIIEAAQAFRQLGVHVDQLRVDLATRDGVDRVVQVVGDRPVDALMANAGHGLSGDFLDQRPEDWMHVINTNVTGALYLVQRLALRMRQRDRGRILFTGSGVSMTAGTGQSVYDAAKAFIDSFAVALREELSDTGITVTCLMPGPTETEFYERAGLLDTEIGGEKKADPAKVAKAGYEAMKNGEGDVAADWRVKQAAPGAGGLA
jgi:short-subunit dehydrogenase